MPSADFCSAVRPPLDGPSRRGDTKQISWGNLSRLPCTAAESTLRVLDGYELRGKLAARPALAPCIRFVLSIGSHVCSTLPYMGTSMSRAKICRQAPLSFGRYCPCDEREARYILAALRSLRQTPPVVPPVADGPGVSLISACGDGKPEAIPRARRGPV